MRFLYNVNSELFLSVKLGLSFLLIAMFYHLKTSKSKLLKNLVILASVFYTLVFFEHIYWVLVSWS
jgi:heme/copper-type cytochrome/quinol oxidase subunit 4